MTVKIIDATFIGAAETLEQGLPTAGLAEIAIIGRSNVGKSTLLNRLTQRRKLARTSSTPGRTQQLNFFQVTFRDQSSKDQTLLLADLPGFGYAKFAKSKRESLSRLIVDYISKREELRVVCLLNDCRRAPERDELAIRDLAFESGKPCLVIVTKLDKLKRSQQAKQLKLIAEGYGVEAEDLILTGEKIANDSLYEQLLVLSAS